MGYLLETLTLNMEEDFMIVFLKQYATLNIVQIIFSIFSKAFKFVNDLKNIIL